MRGRTSERPRSAALRIIQPQFAGDELGKERLHPCCCAVSAAAQSFASKPRLAVMLFFLAVGFAISFLIASWSGGVNRGDA